MFTLKDVVPWGRSFDEYRGMFSLSEEDLASRLLGCGDGPASFNAEATSNGASVVSCDPIYRWSAEEIGKRIDETVDVITDQTRQNSAQFVWTSIRTVEKLKAVRLGSMEKFLRDYDEGKRQGRYVEGALPALPFPSGSFDLAVCSHFLFLYSNHLSLDFHARSIEELCRVAREVRIFPLLSLDGHRSPHVDAVSERLRVDGHEVAIEGVRYEFQHGGNQMMRVRSTAGC